MPFSTGVAHSYQLIYSDTKGQHLLQGGITLWCQFLLLQEKAEVNL